MTDPASLSLGLDAAAGAIVATGNGLSQGDWYRLSLLLADSTPPNGAPLEVKPERLLQERIALRGLLDEIGIDLVADDPVRALLSRSIRDQRAFSSALSQRPIDGDPAGEDKDPGRRVVRSLRPFQVRDFNALAALQHGANFSVPGAGKTTVTYALHARERRSGRATKLVVIAPLSAFGAWEEDVSTVLDPPLSVGRWREDRSPPQT